VEDRALVMELVEGLTLADRIAQGPNADRDKRDCSNPPRYSGGPVRSIRITVVIF